MRRKELTPYPENLLPKDDKNLKAIEAEIDETTRARVVAMCNVMGMRFFEVRLEKPNHEDPNKFAYNGTVNFPLSVAKDLGITKTLNGSKKMGAWLATEEGLQYVKDWSKDRWRRRFKEDNERRIRYEKIKEEQANG